LPNWGMQGFSTFALLANPAWARSQRRLRKAVMVNFNSMKTRY
jgi:hypothetical protein